MAMNDDTRAVAPDSATGSPTFGTDHDGDHPDRVDEWSALRAKYLLPDDQRPASSARGQHHEALLSSDVERTIEFYQGLLEFPLTKLFQNRDYEGRCAASR